jgi:hypothetical protein
MKTTKYITLLVALVGVFSSCNDLLDIPQHGVLNYATYYTTDEEAETAITAAYTSMFGLNYNYTLGKNALTDDFWAGGGGRNDNADLEQLNEFTFTVDQGMLQGMFTSNYSLIYRANVVLNHVPYETDVQKRAHAEAKVFRAWAYFELISMWGNPPLVDHELAQSEYARPNGTTEELWAFVEKDLTEAIESGYLAQKTSLDDKTTWRITKQYAQAILGKAYLWQGKNPEAAAEFGKVIDSKLYDLYEGPYENIRKWDNPRHRESMFESTRIYDAPNEWNYMDMTAVMLHWRTDKLDGALNSLPDALGSTGWGFFNPQKSLYDAFVGLEGEDGYRLNSTIKTYEQLNAPEHGIKIKDGNTIIAEGFFFWKWRVYQAEMPGETMSMFSNLNNPRWMRFGEVLLLAAEAYLGAGNMTKAVECFNRIRTRAQLPTVNTLTLDDIKLEKRLELCGEGTRFQDIIRWRDAENLMKNQGARNPLLHSNGTVEYQVFNEDAAKFGFKEKHWLLPYPGAEIRLNLVIQQNPGW